MQRKRARKIKAMIDDSPPQIRGRFRLLQQFMGYTRSRIGRYAPLPTFAPLVTSINDLNDTLTEIEDLFIRAHDDGTDNADFERSLLKDYIPDLSEAISVGRPSYAGCDIPDDAEQFAVDAESIMDAEWRELASLVEQLEDGLQGIDPPPLRLAWQRDQ